MTPCLFNLHAEYIMRNSELDEAQAGIKTAGRNIKNLRYADNTTLMAESKDELKSLLMNVKEESEKVTLKLNIQKTNIMVWSHHFMANRWGNSGNSDNLILGVSKSLQIVTATMKLKDSCSLEEKLCQTTQHIKKQKHYFANKGPPSQSSDFSSSHVRMWE